MSWWEDVLDFGKDVLYDTVVGADGKEKSTLSDLGLLLSLGGGYLLGDSDMAKPDITPTGYQGKVKEYTAVRDRVPMQPDPNRRPGEGGRRYFSDIQYAARPATTPPTVEEARAASQAQAAALAQGNAQNFRRGGLARLFNDPTRREAIQSRFDRLQASRDARRARLDARRAGLGGMFNQKMPAQPAVQVPDIRPPRDFMPPTLEPNPVEANNPFGLPTKMTREEYMDEAIPIRPLSGNTRGILSQIKQLPQAPQQPAPQQPAPQQPTPQQPTPNGNQPSLRAILDRVNPAPRQEYGDWTAINSPEGFAVTAGTTWLNDYNPETGMFSGTIGGAVGNSEYSTEATPELMQAWEDYQARQQSRVTSADLGSRVADGISQFQQQFPQGNTMPSAPPGAKEQRPTAGSGVASLMGFAQGGYLKGATDGMADEVPATIDGRQEARLSDGEFVIPADVVSHLGNGNSEAGAKVLEQMMSRVRKERTGNAKQGKQINPEKMTPK